MHSLSSVRFAPLTLYIFFFFNDTATTEIYTLSLHDALPICGEARDVVEDVRRLGGFGIAAHPDSPKTELRWREWTADRKSTRLNSSHLVISYAVFCLKKKKNKARNMDQRVNKSKSSQPRRSS